MFSSEELKSAYQCSLTYPVKRGFSFFSNKKITKCGDALDELEFNPAIVKFG